MLGQYQLYDWAQRYQTERSGNQNGRFGARLPQIHPPFLSTVPGTYPGFNRQLQMPLDHHFDMWKRLAAGIDCSLEFLMRYATVAQRHLDSRLAR